MLLMKDMKYDETTGWQGSWLALPFATLHVSWFCPIVTCGVLACNDTCYSNLRDHAPFALGICVQYLQDSPTKSILTGQPTSIDTIIRNLSLYLSMSVFVISKLSRIHQGSSTYPLRIDCWKMTFLIKMVPFQGLHQTSGGNSTVLLSISYSILDKLISHNVGTFTKWLNISKHIKTTSNTHWTFHWFV